MAKLDSATRRPPGADDPDARLITAMYGAAKMIDEVAAERFNRDHVREAAHHLKDSLTAALRIES